MLNYINAGVVVRLQVAVVDTKRPKWRSDIAIVL
jgi:hypothetical protein